MNNKQQEHINPKEKFLVSKIEKQDKINNKFKNVDEDILSAQNYIRESPEFQFDKPLTDIGSRVSSIKTFALLNHQTPDGTKKRIIAVVEFSGAPQPVANSKFFRFILTKLKVKQNHFSRQQ